MPQSLPLANNWTCPRLFLTVEDLVFAEAAGIQPAPLNDGNTAKEAGNGYLFAAGLGVIAFSALGWAVMQRQRPKDEKSRASRAAALTDSNGQSQFDVDWQLSKWDERWSIRPIVVRW